MLADLIIHGFTRSPGEDGLHMVREGRRVAVAGRDGTLPADDAAVEVGVSDATGGSIERVQLEIAESPMGERLYSFVHREMTVFDASRSACERFGVPPEYWGVTAETATVQRLLNSGRRHGEPRIVTVGELASTLAAFKDEFVEDDILAMDICCACGADCAVAMVRGNELVQVCPDERDAIVTAVVEQLRIFYFG